MTHTQPSVAPHVGRAQVRDTLAVLVARLAETVEVATLPLAQSLSSLRTFTVTHLAPHAERLLAPMGVWTFFLLWAGQGVRNAVGWVGYGLAVVLTGAAFIALFVSAGRTVTLRRLPVGVTAFTLVTCVSILWSQYPWMTAAAALATVATTGVGVMVAIAFPLRALVDHLMRALQWTLGLSLGVEVFVAVVVRHPVPPLTMLGSRDIAPSAYWVDGLLLQGGPIQGIVGNRNPLAFIALMAALCVAVTWLDHRMSNARAAAWLGVCLLVLALTRSATVELAALACAAVLVGARVIASVPAPHRRAAVRVAIALALVLGVGALVMHGPVSSLLGRDPDLTGRTEIWDRVMRLWELRPVTGWGWIIYWAPWIPMFRYLVVRGDGAPTMSAHNAYMETLFQVGAIGLVVLVATLVWLVRATYRAALRALDTDVMALFPALALSAMLIQSVTESRLLSEGNWMLVAVIATWVTVREKAPSLDPDPGRMVETTGVR